MFGGMTGETDQEKAENKPASPRGGLALRRARYWARKAYRPWGRISARFLDYLAAKERRQNVASIVLAVAINIMVLTLLSTFARVRIFIPNAPSDTIQLTLVEPLPFDLPLRDPELDPEPEVQEPEVVEEPEPEPEPEIVEEEEITPEPDPVPEPPQEAEAQPEPEPEIVREPEPEPEPVEPEVVEEPEPEPEPQLDLDVSPQLAPEAIAPEPLIAEEPTPAEPEEFTLEQPEPVEDEQLLAEEAPEPLVSVEPEEERQPGVDDILGEDEAQGEDEAEAPAEEEEEEPEEEAPADAPVAEVTGDDMFDQEPSLSSRRFVLPQVALPSFDNLPAGAASDGTAVLPTDSGVVAIFCPEQFDDEDKQKECAGRREIRSGWRPGDSGENWDRAVELLKQNRARGATGPSYGPVADTLARRREADRVIEMRNSTVAAPGAVGDNVTSTLEANRPDIGPKSFEPNWTVRDTPEGISEKDLEELRRSVEGEDGDDN